MHEPSEKWEDSKQKVDSSVGAKYAVAAPAIFSGGPIGPGESVREGLLISPSTLISHLWIESELFA